MTDPAYVPGTVEWIARREAARIAAEEAEEGGGGPETDPIAGPAVTEHNASGAAHADIRTELSALSDAVESSSARRVEGGDLEDAFTLDLDGDKSVWMDGTLTENCTLTLDGLSVTSEAVLLLTRVGGDWTLALVHGEDSDAVPITAGVTELLVHARSVDGVALSVAVYEEGVVEEGGGGGEGGDVAVTALASENLGDGVTAGSVAPSYEIRGDFLRLTGSIVVATGFDNIHGFGPLLKLPAELTPANHEQGDLQSAIRHLLVGGPAGGGVGSPESAMAYVLTSHSPLPIELWFNDDYTPGGDRQFYLNGLGWTLAP